MAETTQFSEVEDPMRRIGPDFTATFDKSGSNPTERASSEAQNAATAVEGDNDEDLDEQEFGTADVADEDAADLVAADDEDDFDEDEDEDEDDEDGDVVREDDDDDAPATPLKV